MLRQSVTGAQLMVTTIHPYIELRRRVRQSAKQYRHNNDTSQSLFNPAQGFVYAYDLHEVEQALDDYEETLETEFEDAANTLSPLDYVLKEAQVLSTSHASPDIRSFALEVMQLLKKDTARKPVSLFDVAKAKKLSDD